MKKRRASWVEVKEVGTVDEEMIGRMKVVWGEAELYVTFDQRSLDLSWGDEMRYWVQAYSWLRDWRKGRVVSNWRTVEFKNCVKGLNQ